MKDTTKPKGNKNKKYQLVFVNKPVTLAERKTASGVTFTGYWVKRYIDDSRE